MVRLLTALETIQVSECDSLKEIVHLENASEIEPLEFPELRSLVLQSLYQFIGFDPTSATEGAKILFHGKVCSKLSCNFSLLHFNSIYILLVKTKMEGASQLVFFKKDLFSLA